MHTIRLERILWTVLMVGIVALSVAYLTLS